MFRRTFWFAAGAGASLWAVRRVRGTVARYRPDRVADDLGATLRRALEEGRAGMREREAQLRAELGPRALPPARR